MQAGKRTHELFMGILRKFRELILMFQYFLLTASRRAAAFERTIRPAIVSNFLIGKLSVKIESVFKKKNRGRFEYARYRFKYEFSDQSEIRH